MKNFMLKILGKIFLSKEAHELGKSFKESGIKGAEAKIELGRISFSVPAQEVQKSKDFKKLQAVAKQIVK